MIPEEKTLHHLGKAGEKNKTPKTGVCVNMDHLFPGQRMR